MAYPRKAALATGEIHYHGKPCRRCKGTLRYTLNADCVACSGKRSLEVKRRQREQYRAARAARLGEVQP